MTAEDMPPPGHCLKLLEWSVDEAPEQTQEEAPEQSAKRTLEATQEEDVGHGQSAKRQRTGAFEVPRVTPFMMREWMMQQHDDIVRQQDDAIVRRLACPACAQELVGWIVQAEADLKKVVAHRPNGHFFTHRDQLLAAVERSWQCSMPVWLDQNKVRGKNIGHVV